ncbi:MAG: hypothetical protein AAGD06_04495 [Acidobacteriota bacterium]
MNPTKLNFPRLWTGPASLALAFVLLTAPAQADSSAVSTADSAARAATAQVMESYRGRLVELNRQGRAVENERREVLAQLYKELDSVLAGSGWAPLGRGLADCQQACNLVSSALTKLASADNLAFDSWIASCSSSSTASDAYVNAHNAEYETSFVRNDVCLTQTCDVAELKAARDLAFDAWVDAADAFDNDGCDSDMESAAIDARDAYFDLRDAVAHCAAC